MKNGSFVRGAVQISLFSALIACSAFFSFPIFSVPITLQSLAVFLALFILGSNRGTLAVILYVLLGIVGLPVFGLFGRNRKNFRYRRWIYFWILRFGDNLFAILEGVGDE